MKPVLVTCRRIRRIATAHLCLRKRRPVGQIIRHRALIFIWSHIPRRLGSCPILTYINAMSIFIKPFVVVFIAALLPQLVFSQDTPLPPVPASDVVLADFLYLKRPVVVFADSPNDPNYIRQMELLTHNTADLIEREVIIITDTTPNPPSEIRQKLRPRGFSLVLIDKDGEAELRKPLPWDTREITHAIDKFPSRRIEMLERSPSGL